MWKENDLKIVFRCKVKERDKVVISNAAIELYAEIPQPKAKKPAEAPKSSGGAAAAPAAASAEPISADVFRAIELYLESKPDAVAKVGTIFQFKLASPSSAWLVDAKNGKGSVKRGEGTADVTLEMSDADFLGMCTGKLDAQKLYFGGQLKLSGNVMAAQKLQFLQKMDPAIALKALNERLAKEGGAVPPQQNAVAPAADAGSDAPTSADVFVAIRHHLSTHPELAPKVGTTFLFKLTNPESAWLIDAKNGQGAVTQGTAAADVTLELSDADFIGMASGKLDAQKLYFGGKLKISGNVMAAQKLDFLKKVDPEAAKAAVLAERKKQGSGASTPNASPTATAASASAKAPAIFAKLKERLAQNANLATEVGAVLQFKTRSPEGAWVVDLKSKPASVREGTATDAAATITVDDEDLAALVTSADGGRSLYQHGKLRIDGDAHFAQKLSFLKGLG
jgi:(3R)-3-hydroxyacyl-CoA dehydrogenase / 3a,7a,12a-trihydroxy-5b-cholest-24-enoyl-CoA hydratase / enoyl-CoA hydratase 2